MNSKMTTSSKLSTNEPKKKKEKQQKQLEQKQNQKNGHHIEGFQWVGRREIVGKRYREEEA